MKVSPVRIWVLWAVPLALVVITYSRLAPERLYRVSEHGISGGLGRALGYVAFPIALVAIALVGATFPALTGWRRAGALAAVVLCLMVAVPGVMDQDNMDARWVMTGPAAGVAVAVVVTWRVTWPQVHVPKATLPVAAALGVLSLPWIAAEAGFHLPGGVFLTDRLVSEPGETGLWPAVHLGDHHGLSAALLIVTALALWPVPRSGPRTTSRRLTQGYLALLVSYGAVNLVQDFWGEQIAARGWTHWYVPDALEPGLSVMWLVIVAGAVVAYLLPRPVPPRPL